MSVQKIDVVAIKRALHTRYDKITKEEVNEVLGLFPAKTTLPQIADFFGVHEGTISDWKAGRNEPHGANKMVFNYLMFKYGIKPIREAIDATDVVPSGKEKFIPLKSFDEKSLAKTKEKKVIKDIEKILSKYKMEIAETA